MLSLGLSSNLPSNDREAEDDVATDSSFTTVSTPTGSAMVASSGAATSSSRKVGILLKPPICCKCLFGEALLSISGTSSFAAAVVMPGIIMHECCKTGKSVDLKQALDSEKLFSMHRLSAVTPIK